MNLREPVVTLPAVAGRRKVAGKKEPTPPNGNGQSQLVRELWQAAVKLRGSIEPADYKRYVLPIIFLRFLSLRYERRREELKHLIEDTTSEYYNFTNALDDPDEYRAAGAFVVPTKARWDHIRDRAQADDIKVLLDDALELLEKTYPDKLRGLLPRIYAGSNLDRENVTGLINLFSKEVFAQDHGGLDLVGLVYEYFIGWGSDRIPDKDPRLVLGTERLPLAPRNANTMWILHFLSHLAEGGTAGFVMATGELSNGETARSR